MLITFRDWKFSYFIAFLSRLSAWAELWKLRNKKMGVSLKRGRIEARVARFRKFKREKKGLLASQVLLWGWPERTRDGERRGARWRGGERGRRCVPCAWGCEDGVRDAWGAWGSVGSADWRTSITECQVARKELSGWEFTFNSQRPVLTGLRS